MVEYRFIQQLTVGFVSVSYLSLCSIYKLAPLFVFVSMIRSFEHALTTQGNELMDTFIDVCSFHKAHCARVFHLPLSLTITYTSLSDLTWHTN